MIGAPSPPPPGTKAKELWQGIRERAAVLGAFEPLELIKTVEEGGGSDSESDRLEALSALSSECSEVLDAPAGQWRLDPDSRRSILQDLDESGRLVGLAKSLAGKAADDFGDYLLQAILGNAEIPKLGAIEQLGALRSAVQFAAPLSSETPPLAAVETAVTRTESQDAIQFLLPGKLWGRDEQIAKMEAFAESGGAAQSERASPWRALVISGVGGSGKSAILAELARRSRRDGWDGMPIIWLDFDRVSLASADSTTLMLEFVRQLTPHREELASQLSKFREEFRGLSAGTEAMNFSQSGSRASGMWSLWKGLLQGALPIEQPVVLILDTYEEILLRSDGRDDEIRRWLDDLAIEGELRNLLPVFSGRAFPKPWLDSLGERVADEIALGDLGPEAALRLLREDLKRSEQKPEEYPLAALVETFGGNPLMLKILSRYLAENGPETARDLLDEGEGGDFQKSLSKGFLYDRILKRLRVDDEGLRKLAHPGLTLRRVTPDIIQKVLAGPCGLGDIDTKHAKKLYEHLSRQVWLVDAHREAGAVHHRRDLRRLVLGLMSEDDRKASQAIHLAAARYYAERRDPALSEHDQAIEAAYHGLFVPDWPELPETAFRELAQALGSDVNDLPARWRAQLKLAGGKGLTSSELGALDEEHGARYVEQSERSYLKRASPSSKSDASASGAPAPTVAPPSFVSTEGEFAIGNFEAVAQHGERAVNEFASRVLMPGGESSYDPVALTSMALWRVGIAADPDQRQEIGMMLANEVEGRFYDLEWGAPFDRYSKQTLSLAQGTAAVFGLLRSGVPTSLNERLSSERWLRIDSVDGLRAFQFCRRLGDQGVSDFKIRIEHLRYLDMSFLDLILAAGAYEAGVEIEVSAGTQSTIHDLLDQARGSSGPVPLHQVQYIRAGHMDLMVRGHIASGTQAAALLRGITPELYPAIQALLEKGTDEPLRAFAAEASQVRTLWPAELQGSQLDLALRRDRARAIGTMIEIADRAALLERLLMTASRPESWDDWARRLQLALHEYFTAIS
jgi:hypothetical protein